MSMFTKPLADAQSFTGFKVIGFQAVQINIRSPVVV
jgi:hypothetical protein